MIERCKEQLENPSGADWDGTTRRQVEVGFFVMAGLVPAIQPFFGA